MNEAQVAQAGTNTSLAWFKLSEFILRGEKERAFSVYKVLMLAFDSKPFCLLVEGDLHACFGEYSESEEKYLAAAKLYELEKDAFLTSITYEALIKVTNHPLLYWQKLLELYEQIGFQPKVTTALKNLFRLYLDKKADTEAKEVLEKLKALGCSMEEEEAWALYLLQESKHQKEALDNISKVLEEHFTKGNSLELQKFLSKLETLDKEAYNTAITQMKDK